MWLGLTLQEAILIIGFVLVVWNLWIIVDKLKEISLTLSQIKKRGNSFE